MESSTQTLVSRHCTFLLNSDVVELIQCVTLEDQPDGIQLTVKFKQLQSPPQKDLI